MVCVPAISVLIVNVAVLVVDAPVSTPVPSEVPHSLNVTVPSGAVVLPVTVAVNVTG